MVDLPITAFEETASPNARKQFSGQESDDSEDEDDAQQDAKSSLQSPVQKYSIDIDVKMSWAHYTPCLEGKPITRTGRQ